MKHRSWAYLLSLCCAAWLSQTITSLKAARKAGSKASSTSTRAPARRAAKPQAPTRRRPSPRPLPRLAKKAIPSHLLTEHERSQGSRTSRPGHVMPYYRKLAKAFPYFHILKVGAGDGAHPIHLVTLAKRRITHPREIGKRVVLLMNNGIHSGESCGIDATQMMMRDIALQMKHTQRYDELVILAIPVFNVGGHRHFHRHNRVNQNGPERMGFRANARNYDLNRDFVKADTSNMRSFYRVFHQWKPHVFIDNHSTNGADYQHAITYAISDLPHMAPALRHLVLNGLKPGIERSMKNKGLPLAPYVILKKRGDIKKGLRRGFSTPRYSTGFVPLFHAVGILSETHMLKPYKVRVKASYELMRSALDQSARLSSWIRDARTQAIAQTQALRSYPLHWKRLSTHSTVTFRGYAYRKVQSPVTGAPILRYDRNQPRTWTLPYYDQFKPTLRVRVPKAYIVPQQWRRVIQRLRWNGVRMSPLKRAAKIRVEQLLFSHVKWASRPYEGHFRPTLLKVERVQRHLAFRKGDLVIHMNQPANRYILETLEPQAYDSFVRWGFFDAVFQRKEYFDPYLFEPLARKMLRRDKRLRKIFQNRLRSEPAFAKSPYQRLKFLYQSSRYYEASHNVYPIAIVR